MSEPTIRPQVVDLFRRVDAPSLDIGIDNWTIDGRPVTPAEAELLGSMVMVEVVAAMALRWPAGTNPRRYGT
jgi:hypothetical protein